VRSDVVTGLTEERRALIGRYMIDSHAPPAGAGREEPMRREALEVTRQAAVASFTTEVRRKAAEERARREALEAVVRRAAAAEAQARRRAEEERARYEALQEAAARRAAAERAAPRPMGSDLTTRLVDAVIRLQESSDTTATRLERLTWALVLLSISVAALTITVLARG
jgi:hypothetical protein